MNSNKKEYKNKIKEIIKLNKPHKNKIYDPSFINDNELIKLKGVNKFLTNGYNFEHVLKNIDLVINKGEFVVITGPSGSGKTTLLSILSALERPSQGDCYMFGKNTITCNMHDLTLIRANHIGYIFQQYGLLPDLTVKDNILITTGLKENKTDIFDIDELLEKVDLKDCKNKKAYNLSGGQQQRVSICRALVKKPDVLFGDEPTGAIHIEATKQIMKIFTDINNEYKTTIIIVTHNPSIVELADRIIEIESGEIKNNYLNNNKKTVDEINWNI